MVVISIPVVVMILTAMRARSGGSNGAERIEVSASCSTASVFLPSSFRSFLIWRSLLAPRKWIRRAKAAEFWVRAAKWFKDLGVHCQRVFTDNGACYRSRVFRDAVKATATSPRRTQPYRPQTNGKVERFQRILNEEWAYAADWQNDAQRTKAHQIFMHHYNNHRPHGALNYNTPTATLTHPQNRDNVLNMYTPWP